MPILQLNLVTLGYGGTVPVLDGVDLQIDPGERVCLVGRNGAGKSTLMRVLAGEEVPAGGEVLRQAGSVVSRLPQEVPGEITGTVWEVLHSGIDPSRHEEEWESERRIERLAEGMGLPIGSPFGDLSGGWKRRVLLGRALAAAPDLLLLDEPTNHLDVSSIVWLENFLADRTLLFVTHDRSFLRKLATRIIELDRGKLTSWACDYDTYLERKAAWLEGEEKQWAVFDKKLAQEEAWLRQGVKARRTRNEGRVRALEALRSERSKRRERDGKARIEVQEGNISGQKVIECKAVSFGYPSASDGSVASASEQLFRGVNTTIWRGDRVGIIGPNGSGKTTLLKLLLGELKPDVGEVKTGTQLQVVYLDQLRAQIDDEKSVAQNVAGDAETVIFNGKPRHIHSYLQDFLFRSDRVRQPAGHLSGGERNRLLLARLFLQPANVLVLDEPTNDLDIETLEMLEELLIDFPATLLLVSHDRAFLDNVVTSVLVLEGEGRVEEYVGGYSDWARTRSRGGQLATIEARPSAGEAKAERRGRNERPRKFLNRERRELEEMPARIEAFEAEQEKLSEQLWSPELYRTEPEKVVAAEKRLAEIEKEMAAAYARWDELEAIRIACAEE